MNLLNKTPVTLAEAKELAGDLESRKELNDYFKEFSKTSKADVLKLVDELKALNSIKLREMSIVKIADFLPQNAEELNKIVSDVSFSEEESNAILAITGKY